MDDLSFVIIPIEVSIVLTVLCLLIVMRSWYVHYIVKDGLARKMLLYGCAFITIFLSIRAVNLILRYLGIIDAEMTTNITLLNIFNIYAIVIGQFVLQNTGKENKDDKKQRLDNDELKRRRKKGKE